MELVYLHESWGISDLIVSLKTFDDTGDDTRSLIGYISRRIRISHLAVLHRHGCVTNRRHVGSMQQAECGTCVHVSVLIRAWDKVLHVLVVDVQECSPKVVARLVPDDLFRTALPPICECHVTSSQV